MTVGKEVQISYETTLYPHSFTNEFDPDILKLVDMRCEYLSPGSFGGPWRCFLTYRVPRPGRTCAALEYVNGDTFGHLTVIVTP